jgi:hypothetical protein
MATVRVDEEALRVELDGFDALMAFQTSFRVPLEHVQGATTEAPPLNRVYKGIPNLAANIPGVLAAGTYYTAQGRIFWDARMGQELVRIDLKDEKYDKLVLGVKDAKDVVREIHQTRETHQTKEQGDLD